MAKGVNKLYLESDSLTIGEKLLCFIPLFNIVRAEKQWYNKFFLNFFALILTVLCTAFRVAVFMTMRDNEVLTIVSIFAFIAAWIFFFIAQMVFVWQVLTDSDAMTFGKRLLFTIAFPFGQYFIGTSLGNVIRYKQKMASQFDAEYDDEEEYDDYDY